MIDLNCLLVVLNVAELSQALADFVYKVILLHLNFLLGDLILTKLLLVALNVAELSYALTELYSG